MHGGLTGDLCGDGSGLNVQVAKFRRCGWAVCQVAHVGDGPGTVTACVFGALPGTIQEVPKAELYAFYKALQIAIPPIHYHTDCKFVSDGFAGGPAATTMGHHEFADLWRLVWAKVADIGLKDAEGCPLIRVSWIKGHTSEKAVAQGKIKEWQRDGNKRADKAAKAGARLHQPFPTVLTKHDRACKFVTFIAKFMARVSARVHRGPYDATPDRRAKRKIRAAPSARTPREARHQHVWHNGVVTCWLCCTSSRTIKNLEKRKCVRSKINTHTLWECGDFLFCARCGSFSKDRVRLLRRPCPGRPGSETTKAKLNNFKKGIPPYKGSPRATPLPLTMAAASSSTPTQVSYDKAVLGKNDQYTQFAFEPGVCGEDFTINSHMTPLLSSF